MKQNNTDRNDTDSKKEDSNILELNKMGTMPVGKLLRSMSIPAMLSMMVQSMYSIINSIFVGHLGESALTAVTLIFPIQILIIAFGAGTGVGLNSLIARRLGEGRHEEANTAATHVIIFVNWFIFLIFLVSFSHLLVGLYSGNPYRRRCNHIWHYSHIIIFVQVSIEDPAGWKRIYPMISSLAGAISNIIINPYSYLGSFSKARLRCIIGYYGPVYFYVSCCIFPSDKKA